MSEEEVTRESDLPPSKEGEQILKRVSLTLSDLAQKKTLDLGSNERYLEKAAQEKGIQATIVSLDRDEKVLSNGEDDKRNAVLGDAYKGLPFQDNSFDYVINAAGPLTMGQLGEQTLNLLHESLRILKEGGQLRSNDFFQLTGGIPDEVYKDALAGNITILPEAIEQYGQHSENLIRDDAADYKELLVQHGEDPFKASTEAQAIMKSELASLFTAEGLPSKGDFWMLQFYKNYPREEQQAMYKYFQDQLAYALSEEGKHVRIELHETDANRNDQLRDLEVYLPYIVITKLPQQAVAA